MSATASPARHVPPTGMSRASEAVARAHGLPGGGEAWASTLLGRGPEVLEAVLAHWVWGSVANAERLADRHGLGTHAARALVAAVEEMDAHAPEVEMARVWTELSGRAVRPPRPYRPAASMATIARAVPAAPALPAKASPGKAPPPPAPAPRAEPLPALPSLPALLDLAGDDAEWFEENPDRSHRLRPAMSGWVAVRLLDTPDGGRTAALPYPGHPREGGEGGEPEAHAAFEDAAMAWFAMARPCPSPERDALWFSQRPGRRHRVRAPYTTEVAGRLPATWVTLVASHLGRVLCISVDEASLPSGERGDADIAALFRDRASAIACAQSLRVLCDVEEPAPSATTMRPAASRGRQRPAALLTGPSPVDAEPLPLDDEADFEGQEDVADGEAASSPRLGKKSGNANQHGIFEAWEDRSIARAQANHWPCMRVDEAFDVVEDLLASHGSLPIRAFDVRQAARRYADDGAAALATLKAYGLLEAGANGMVRVTPLARDGLGGDARLKREALGRVAIGPSAYRDLLERLGPAPTLDALRALPAAKDMPKHEATMLHDRFVSAMAFRAVSA